LPSNDLRPRPLVISPLNSRQTDLTMNAMTTRHNTAHIDAWREKGFVLIPDFFTADEIAPVCADYEALYGGFRPEHGEAIDVKKEGMIGATHRKQFLHTEILPYQGGIDMNLLSLHPAVIRLARDLLGVPAVHLYQSHTWAKFTGEADYDQHHHCDFGNHTLTVPSENAALRSVDFIIYLTDVTDDLGALHYVEKADSARILGQGEIMAQPEHQQALKACEKSAAAPAGALLAHSIDTFHRGTNLTRKGGHRYTMTAGYKAAGNDLVSFHVWQQAMNRPWDKVINHASPEQLACLGIPEPGDPYWSPRTLKLTQDRWPDWDMTPYFAAAFGNADASTA
jgi:hypothetical protein